MFMPIILGVVVIVAIIAFLMIRYRIGKPDEALIVTGSFLGKEGIKILKNSGTFVIPIVQKAHKLSLLTHKLEIGTPEVYTEQGVPILASATVLVKVGNSVESIKTAAEQYLGKSTSELEDEAQEVLEGHLRAILGTMTVEAIYKNRDDFAEQVQQVASTDLRKMGLEIVSFTIKDVTDPNGYLEALGRPQIAEVKKNAEVAESNALRETRIKQAENEQLAQHEEIRRKTEIAEATKDMQLKQAQYKQEQEVADAKAEQVATGEKMKVRLIEQEKNIEIQEKQAELSEKELNATVRKKAEADKYVMEQNALAEKAREIAKAEAEAEKIRLAAEAEAQRIEKMGAAEADKITKVGQAEAESKEKMALALQKLNEAGILMEFIKVLPEVAKEVNAPISNIDKVVSFGNGDGVHEMGGAGLARTFDTIKETTGLDLVGLINETMATKQGTKEIVQAIENKATNETTAQKHVDEVE
ncbi:flotillin family protein [Enterococcus saccharolyticus]|uniref:flotillin family protein n=1 Tax=Enterococcus saccharolyticus TaxID=41997 RepID=UPI001E43FC1C|nr:SPFH domain-containing protein [Enterococcus saccharolyticus]MCD5003330.1 flotillin family protein [Enterococcus saccharolyticus]